MTAISAQVAEKPANKAEEGVCRDKKTRRWITAVLLCLLFLFITAAFGVGIMVVLNRYPQQTPIDYDFECPTPVPSEWIFWTRVAGRVDLHESALINHDDRTALMVSSEAFKINATNSLALHDYTMGYVALRDFNMCLVSKVSDANFEHVQETLRERQSGIENAEILESNCLETCCAFRPESWFFVKNKDFKVVIPGILSTKAILPNYTNLVL